ncbi:MAG TPA: alpha/beta hydrolase-fold protein [Chthonomonadaceae bacterium]|nr:alpha/beta hydrolase-fold protein [Chthonomonadaceae bacterium]
MNDLLRSGAARLGLCALTASIVSIPAAAQFQRNLYQPADADRAALKEACEHLRREVADLRDRSSATGKPAATLLPDVEIYLDAASRNLEQNLFFSKRNFDDAKTCLADGETRASALAAGSAPWMRQTGVVTLGYRSKIDGSAQPYQVYVPQDYDFDHPSARRLDLFLHGRGGNLNEIAFIRSTGWVRGNFGPTTPASIALQPYGRGNNGWRFCGETDVYEALADCRRRYATDPNQTSLRGFSMGGHGVFTIGLHDPGEWAVISPGAGFVDTVRYLNLKKALPDWQQSLLHLYDAVDVAANAKDVPMIEYVGDLDDKLPQYRLMDAALKRENAPFDEIIAANTPHRYEAGSLLSILAKMAPYRRNPEAPVDFVTYTLRYPRCRWVTLTGLERHWTRSSVRAEALDKEIQVSTSHVTSLVLTPAILRAGGVRAVVIDGQTVPVPTITAVTALALEKRGDRWRLGAPTGLRKQPGLEGPIDDALFGPLVAVAGTGTPWNAPADAWAKLELQRFRECWGRYFRATLPETTDARVTAADVRDRSLYLFGDPGSNAVLRRVLPKLPLKWSRDTITIKGKSFSAKDHLPLLVFPNPENPARYVVIDTGMTFSRADQEGSNAQQYPHLPDYAVIKIDPATFTDDRTRDAELAGFFDESWR